MNCSIINRRIQMLLQETETTFNLMVEAGGHPNMDYAGYTAQTRIHCFRTALQRPELSRMELAAILRRALGKQRSAKSQKTYWSAFMANYLSLSANNNNNDIYE